MKLTVLGCGTYVSGSEKAASGFLVGNGEQQIALDLGFGAFKNLQKVLSPDKVNALFFSHFHPDHIHDLAAFLFNRYGLVKANISVPVQVNLFGPKGLLDYYAKCSELYPGFFSRLGFPVSVKELDYSREKIFGYSVSSKPVKHSGAIGFRVEFAGKTIAYSGDTGYCEEIVDLGKNADLLVLECTFLDEKTSDEHLNAMECGKIAVQAKAKKILLTHLLPETEKKKKEAIEIVKKQFSGKVLVAKDLMEVKV